MNKLPQDVEPKIDCDCSENNPKGYTTSEHNIGKKEDYYKEAYKYTVGEYNKLDMKLDRIREIVEEHFDITQDGTYCLSHSGTKLLKEVLDDE